MTGAIGAVAQSVPTHQAVEQMSRRRRILAGLDVAQASGVEIGALDKPLVTRTMGDIFYVDHADTATLRKKYAGHADVHQDALVEVDGVWGSNALLEATAGRRFDYVLASHVIEHVPDLITWLNEIESILRPGGQIRLVIPDMRYTFDCLRRETVFSDVLAAYLSRARRPMPREVMDAICNVADVRTDLLWHQLPKKAVKRKLHTVADALQLGTSSLSGEYHDVHCWTFTPESFARLMREITTAGLSRLVCSSFTDTPIGHLEFYLSLSVEASKGSLAWDQIERMTRANPATNPLRAALVCLHPRILSAKVQRLAERYCPTLLDRAKQAFRH